MEFIVGLVDKLTSFQKEELAKLDVEIIYESKYLPLIGVNSNQPDEISKLQFVTYIREPREGSYQEGDFLTTIIFQPPVRKRVLIDNQLFGWGDIRIAILDSGVNPEVNVAAQIDFTKTGPSDVKIHGTDVAKIVKHFARGCNIYSAKVGVYRPNELYVMQGLEWAAENGASIINISAGFKKKCRGDCDLCKLINEISKHDIAIVVAAGNNENAEDSIECPGRASGAVTVGAIDGSRKMAPYSSFGKRGGDKPNLVAPGDVLIDGRPLHGTSFSTPLVSGVLGAILQRVGTVSKAIEYIYRTVDDLELPRHQQGLGCINLENLVELVMNETAYLESKRQDQSS